MRLRIEQIVVPAGSTLGFGVGVPVDDETKRVYFAGDWRPMAGIGTAMMAADGPFVVDVPDFAILEISELPEG